MMTLREDIVDTDIQALVDNELSWEQEKEIRAYMDVNPSAKGRYTQLLTQKKLLQKWWHSIHASHH